MDVTGVSQLLDHPTPGGTEYLGRTGQDIALRLVRRAFRNRLPTTGWDQRMAERNDRDHL